MSRFFMVHCVLA